MIEKLVFEDKDRESLYKKMNSPLSEFYYREEIEEGKIFKSTKYKITAVRKEEIRQYIKSYLSEICNLMGIDIQFEIRQDEDVINVSMISDDSPILIGKEGKNLSALQILLRQSLFCQTGLKIKVNLDVADYKLKKQKRLENEIKQIAEEVLNSKIDAKLDPMNSFDRRVVHSVIHNYQNLETESIGESPNRFVIIKYKED